MCAAIAAFAVKFKESDDDFLQVDVDEADDFVEAPTATKINRDQYKERRARVAAAAAEMASTPAGEEKANVMQGTVFARPKAAKPANTPREPVQAKKLLPHEIVQHRYICLVTQGTNIAKMAVLLANPSFFPAEVVDPFLSLNLGSSSLRDFRIQATNEEIAVIREIAERIPSALPSKSNILHVKLAAAKILVLYKERLLQDMKAASKEYVASCTEQYQEQVLKRIASTLS